uniref:Uncharacterized protein n=1 Tax=Strongyloides stercoralis TaxID=6248 RepID=A0A0K0DSC8_STRER
MTKIVYGLFLIPLIVGEYLFYDTECPTNISRLEGSFYTALRVSSILTNFVTINVDFELIALTYNQSNSNEIIRIDGRERFPRNEVWTKKYIPIKSWPLYLHPNCLKYYIDKDDCLPRMDALIFYPINTINSKDSYKFKKYRFEQFFPCSPDKVLSLSHNETVSLQNKSAVFIPREKPIYYIQDFNFEEFSLDNLHDHTESQEYYMNILRDLEEFEEFTIEADVNFRYDFEEPLGPFKKVSDLIYKNGDIIEI